MVMDQAGWHLAGELVVPENMRLLFLPPYSPELNPAEHLWEALREECFANHVFAGLDAVEHALIAGLRSLEADPSRTQSMTGFKWITSIRLNATYYESSTAVAPTGSRGHQRRLERQLISSVSTTGAWSLGRSFLRGSLSMTQASTRPLSAVLTRIWSMRRPWFLRNARLR